MERFFILACQRSGTTMLQQALNRHSRIVIPPETGFFTHFIGHSAKGQAHHLRRINADLGIDLPRPRKRIRRREDTIRFYDQMATAYLEKLSAAPGTMFGEKTPHHLLRVRRIIHAFPDAKYILVHRDGRDVALSLTRVPWFCSDLQVTFSYWLRCCRASRWLRDQGNVNLLVLRYEDLVTQPEVELRRIAEFLGLDYEPEMAEGSGNVEGTLPWEADWKTRATTKITSARIGNWRRELSPTQVSRLERWGGSVLKDLGYEVSTNSGAIRLPLHFFPCLYAKILLWRGGNAWRVARKNIFGR